MTASIVCPVCGRPAHNATICRTCQRQLRTRLQRLPALLRELEVTALKRDHTTPRSEVRSGNIDQPLPFKPKAAALLSATTSLLADTLANLGLPPDPTRHPAGMIAAHLDMVKRAVWAPGFALDIEARTRRIIAMIDTPQTRARIHVGPCPETDDAGADCGGDVWAAIPADGTVRPVMACTMCGREWSTESWARLGDRIRQLETRRERSAVLARQVAGVES